jgi:hypothetical protein
MRDRRDDERRTLNAIESELWTSDPEFYRRFDQEWNSRRGRSAVAADRRRAPIRWLLPVGLILTGLVLCLIVIRSRP